MASFAPSSKPNLSVPDASAANDDDPFVSNASSGPAHHRFSNFDQDLFASGPGSSPRQAKRALEAHLAETERRLDEAGKLGTALVTQRKALTEQLQKVDKLQAEGELGPELREKLVEIEKEYNDLARESARAFLPKQRVPSNEAGAGSPFVSEGRSGRRSVSPSKFESQATGSPTKLSVPNRKIRNQPSNRVHDIEFAAEISTSLIAQVRNLQSLLAERDEEVRDLKNDKSSLEIESENLQQRLRALDESEHRYKEENWNLETRLQEFSSQQREASDREKKLSQALATSNLEKNTAQKELDEVKLSHSKLTEEHAAAIKHHDIELGTAKRSAVVAESERAALRRKIDDLTSQNQELAKAFATQRGRIAEHEATSGQSEDDFETATDNITPENSPPASPVKGTPRHSVLETETMKTSLHHAQRTIQSQRSLIHREKTEKLELRRIIQDLRDDLERSRVDNGAAGSTKRGKKTDSKDLKKQQSRLLGSMRSSRQEIVMDDPEWEDHVASPTASSTRDATRQNQVDSTDQFDTANEASESGFETAHERATETEDFQTGNEAMSDSDGAATETETTSKGFGRMKHMPSLPAGLSRHVSRPSFQSTASTSGDEDDLDNTPEVTKTPTASISSLRSRFRFSRGPFSRSSRQGSEEPSLRSSPSLASSASGTPQAPGQTLFAELQDFEGSDDESVGNVTPSRRSLRSATPASARRPASPPPAVPHLPKVIMVDSGVMTEPVEIRGDAPIPVNGEQLRPSSTSWLIRGTDHSRPVSGLSYSDSSTQHETGIGENLDRFPVPPSSPPAPPELSISTIQSENVEPRDEVVVPPTPPAMALTPVVTESVEPVAEPEVPPPTLSLSTVSTEHVVPIEAPETPAPELAMSSILAEVLEPKAEPAAAPTALSMSYILGEQIEPVEEPEPVPEPRAIVPVVAPVPVEPEEPKLPELGFTSLAMEHVEPVSEPEVVIPSPELGLSTIYSEQLEPRAEPEVIPEPAPLGYSNISTQHVVPVLEPAPTPPKLVLSSIARQGVEPTAPMELDQLPNFGFSAIKSIETRPITPRSPRRDAIMLPRDRDHSETPRSKNLDDVFGSPRSRSRSKDAAPLIAEDETRQAVGEAAKNDARGPRQPFKEISANIDPRYHGKLAANPTSDQGAQTSLTAETIDALFKTRSTPDPGHSRHLSASSIGTQGTTGTVRINRPAERAASPTPNPKRDKGEEDSRADAASARRPGSSASGRTTQDAPPLPSNHLEAIEAARTGSAGGVSQPGSMGPPLWPASAMKQRPRTPSLQRPPSSGQSGARGGPTPRASRNHYQYGSLEPSRSPAPMTLRSQSSVSSFASEIEGRFNMQPADMMDATGLGPNTDPRMIQAITQTMIGEYLWKYTRKAGGRGEMSEKRHRRYFWVHPYTRTLYWSDRDPSMAGRSELRAKSVPIEAVRVVTDDNPMPPGLHRKSLIIIAPGRSVKFTCTTGQRHETWFNALSYLLLRTNADGQSDAEDMVENLTREDVDEFNPQFGTRPAAGHRSRAPPSLSSYNSRTSRTQPSPTGDVSMNFPTLTPSGQRTSPPGQKAPTPSGTLGKFGSYWKTGGSRFSETISSLRSRGTGGGHAGSVYGVSEVHDSAEDVREIIEQQDRAADRLENVRACCDGKHDVGRLSHTGRRSRASHGHTPGHPASSTTSTPMASIRSRA